ncbi:hypothetical protein CQ018_18220 [Arthrobacter sp. MYb227]|nr:hypothetical protein CQ018_18220 [Arthrobacter sp. MYb227]
MMEAKNLMNLRHALVQGHGTTSEYLVEDLLGSKQRGDTTSFRMRVRFIPVEDPWPRIWEDWSIEFHTELGSRGLVHIEGFDGVGAFQVRILWKTIWAVSP